MRHKETKLKNVKERLKKKKKNKETHMKRGMILWSNFENVKMRKRQFWREKSDFREMMKDRSGFRKLHLHPDWKWRTLKTKKMLKASRDRSLISSNGTTTNWELTSLATVKSKGQKIISVKSWEKTFVNLKLYIQKKKKQKNYKNGIHKVFFRQVQTKSIYDQQPLYWRTFWRKPFRQRKKTP